METEENVLYIDGENIHEDDPKILALHPSKISFLSFITKGSFAKAVIQNVPTNQFSSLGFFYVANALKEDGLLEVYVHQKLGAIQPLEADEIEALAGLAGFVDIRKSQHQIQLKQGGKVSSIKLTMVRSRKVLLLNN